MSEYNERQPVTEGRRFEMERMAEITIHEHYCGLSDSTPCTCRVHDVLDLCAALRTARECIADERREQQTLREKLQVAVSFQRGWGEIEAALGRTDEERAREDLTHHVKGMAAKLTAKERECERLRKTLRSLGPLLYRYQRELELDGYEDAECGVDLRKGLERLRAALKPGGEGEVKS